VFKSPRKVFTDEHQGAANVISARILPSRTTRHHPEIYLDARKASQPINLYGTTYPQGEVLLGPCNGCGHCLKLKRSSMVPATKLKGFTGWA